MTNDDTRFRRYLADKEELVEELAQLTAQLTRANAVIERVGAELGYMTAAANDLAGQNGNLAPLDSDELGAYDRASFDAGRRNVYEQIPRAFATLRTILEGNGA